MTQQTSYIFRGGLVTLAGLLMLFVLYVSLGWIIVASSAESLHSAQQQYDLMFPESLRLYGVRQMLSIIASVSAVVLALAGLRHAKGFRRHVAYAVITLAPLFAFLNLWWLM